jgi:hypothetical protein
MPTPSPLTTNLMPMGRNAAQNQGSGQSLMPTLPPGAPPSAPQGPPAPASAPPIGAAPQMPPPPQFEAVAQEDGSSLIMLGGKVVAFNPAPKMPKQAAPQGVPIAMQPPM